MCVCVCVWGWGGGAAAAAAADIRVRAHPGQVASHSQGQCETYYISANIRAVIDKIFWRNGKCPTPLGQVLGHTTAIESGCQVP